MARTPMSVHFLEDRDFSSENLQHFTNLRKGASRILRHIKKPDAEAFVTMRLPTAAGQYVVHQDEGTVAVTPTLHYDELGVPPAFEAKFGDFLIARDAILIAGARKLQQALASFGAEVIVLEENKALLV